MSLLQSMGIGLSFVWCVVGGQTVNAEWIQIHKLMADDAVGGEELGYAVSVSGELAVVGAPWFDGVDEDSGAVYVYHTLTGELLHKLTADDAGFKDYFGYSVGIDGDVVTVGAPGNDSAYVFDASSGAQIHVLIGNDTTSDDEYGRAAAISGNLAVVGAPGHAAFGADSGTAYIFDVTTGQQLHKLIPLDGHQSDQFGTAVGISGTLAIVGARHGDSSVMDAGTAYIFDATTGVQIHKLVASDGAQYDHFGFSVAISADLCVVGAYGHKEVWEDAGAAYVFDVVTGQELHILTATDPQPGDYFGYSVSTGNEVVAVGAIYDDGTAGTDAGAAYLFDSLTGECLNQLTASDAVSHADFGKAVGISSDVVLVGAQQDDEAAEHAGAAYVFGLDSDSDGVLDSMDNCPFHFNPDQADCDEDGVGDVCTIIDCDGSPWCEDCNLNGVPDGCDLADGTSEDCQPNGVPDECDIADGTSLDIDSNGIPDDCECLADLYEDGIVDVLDLMVVFAKWGPCPPEGECPGDVTFDGAVDVLDLLALLGAWGPCPQ